MKRLLHSSITAAAMGLLALGAVPAGAATVSSDGGVLRVSDTQGEQNIIYLQPPGFPTAATDEVIVRSGTDALSGGAGCAEAPPEQATYKREFHCARGEHMTLEVHLGGGNDSLYGYPEVPYDSGVIDGGPGHDDLETVSGSPDEFIGGDGFDIVRYGYTQVGITASLDGLPNDGAPGEGDKIDADVEGLSGGFGSDHLYGNDARNKINGGSGDDVIAGGAGDDVVSGDEDKDQIDGGPGQDEVDGAEWPHYQSPDTLDCGSGFDYARLSEYDTETGCENGSYPMGGGTGWTTSAPPGTPYPGWLPPPESLAGPMPTIASSGTANPRAGVVRVAARCRSTTDACRGRLTLKRAKRGNRRQLGSARLSLAHGSRKKVSVRLNAYGRRALKGRHTLRVSAVLTPSKGGTPQRRSLLLRVVG